MFYVNHFTHRYQEMWEVISRFETYGKSSTLKRKTGEVSMLVSVCLFTKVKDYGETSPVNYQKYF